jgi:hypothetical protein
VTIPTSTSRRPRSKRNDENAVPNSSRECSECRYALYPATSRCSNYECPRYARESGSALTAAQLLYEYAEPRLFHGRRWGSWVLDVERLCLTFEGEPVVRGGIEGCPEYVAYLGRYEVDVERVSNSAAALDWFYQINKKAWANARVMKDLLNAFDDIFDAQANLCSGSLNGGGSKVIQNPSAFLKHRIATVGKDSPLGDVA